MCDPLTIAGLALSAASTIGTGIAQNRVAGMNRRAQEENVRYRESMRRAELARQEEQRRQANEAWAQALERSSEPAQTEQLQTEQQRLSDLFNTRPDPVDDQGQIIGDVLLSGQDSDDERTRQAFATSLAEEAGRARDRIEAMATLSAYGPSSGGLDRFVSQNLAESGRDIFRTQSFRRGGLNALNTELAVEPIQYDYRSTGLGEILGAAGSAATFGGSAGVGLPFLPKGWNAWLTQPLFGGSSAMAGAGFGRNYLATPGIGPYWY